MFSGEVSSVVPRAAAFAELGGVRPFAEGAIGPGSGRRGSGRRRTHGEPGAQDRADRRLEAAR
jgi:hypothetical protein